MSPRLKVSVLQRPDAALKRRIRVSLVVAGAFAGTAWAGMGATLAGKSFASAGSAIGSQPALACHSHSGLPDKHCTPGAKNPNVTQANTGKTICVAGWTKKIRPPTSKTNPVKAELEIAYGIPAPHPQPYKVEELDHLIPLELGGAPFAKPNFWPQSASGLWGYKRKDTLEHRLKRLVCSHKLALASAQRAIASNWEAAYLRYVGAAP